MATVLDIECESWDRFLVGSLYRDDSTVLVTREPDELIDAALSCEGDVWAHNGGRYDWLWLLNHLAKREGSKARIHMSGSSATRIDVGQTRLRDSLRLIPIGLGKAAPIAGMAKSELDPVLFPCVCERECGGYCSLNRDMSDLQWTNVTEYLVQDCRVLSAVLDYVHEYCADNQIVMRGTVGGTSWATAKRMLGLRGADWEPSQYKQIRLAFSGGRTECGVMLAPVIDRHDIHAAYPAALHALDLPIGYPTMMARSGASLAFESRRPGVYAAVVQVPDSMSPPLPYRGEARMYYPHGEITGVWALPELAHAVDDCGVDIVRFEWAAIWPDSAPIMREPTEHVWRLRAAAMESNPALARWLKFVANATYGKLAQDPETRLVVMDATLQPNACQGGECIGFCSPSICCKHHCSGKCKSWDALDPHGRLWSRKVWRLADCAYIHWAAYLTAATRVELHRQIQHAGDDWIYSDTDSVIASRRLDRRNGDGLGEWGYEGTGRDWKCIAPKAYAYETDDKPVIRCKGLGRITMDTWRDYCAGKPVPMDNGVMGLLSAARDGGELFRRQRMSRRAVGREGWCGGRVIEDDGVTTRAPTMEEIE